MKPGDLVKKATMGIWLYPTSAMRVDGRNRYVNHNPIAVVLSTGLTNGSSPSPLSSLSVACILIDGSVWHTHADRWEPA